MTGHVNQLVRQRRLAYRFDVVNIDGIVVAIPERAQQTQHQLDRQLAAVGEDFAAVAMRAGKTLQFLFRLFDDDLLHFVGCDHAFSQLAPRRDLRTEGRFALTAQRFDQVVLQCLFIEAGLRQDLAEILCMGKDHACVAAVDQQREKLARAPGQRPAVGEQHLDEVFLPRQRSAPEHRYRYDLEVERRILLRCGDEIAQQHGVFAPVTNPVDQRTARRHAVDGVMSCERGQRKRRLRCRQAARARNTGQQQQVGQAAIGEHVQGRALRVHDRRRVVVGKDLDPNPEEQ